LTTSSASATLTTKPPNAVDSPNLLTFGLSKGTLGKLGFRFKEDLQPEVTLGGHRKSDKPPETEVQSTF
jgi:hypothetical protein